MLAARAHRAAARRVRRRAWRRASRAARARSKAGRCRCPAITMRSMRWRPSRSRREAGIADDAIRAAMAAFSGVKRRFQLTGEWNGVAIYDDYGHHPAEIAAVLAAARARREGPRHRRRRAASLHARARSVRRVLRLLQGCRQRHRRAALYGGREPDRRHRPPHARRRHPRRPGTASVDAVDEPARPRAGCSRRMARPGDMVVCLGAGNSTEWAHALPDWLGRGAERAGGARGSEARDAPR